MYVYKEKEPPALAATLADSSCEGPMLLNIHMCMYMCVYKYMNIGLTRGLMLVNMYTYMFIYIDSQIDR